MGDGAAFVSETKAFWISETGGTPGLPSKLYKNSFDLPRQRVQRAIGPHHEIGAGYFLFHRPLRSQALLDLLRRPPAREQSFALGRGGTGDANDFVKMGFGRVSKSSGITTTASARFSWRQISTWRASVRRCAGEGWLRVFCAPWHQRKRRAPVHRGGAGRRGHNLFPEGGLDFVQRGLAGLNELARQFVGVHHCAPRLRRNSAAVDFPMPCRRSDRRPSLFFGNQHPTAPVWYDRSESDSLTRAYR